MVNFIQMVLATLYFGLGLVLAYFVPYKLGGIIQGLFTDTTTTVYFIITAFRYILMIFFAFLLPLIFLAKPQSIDRTLKHF